MITKKIPESVRVSKQSPVSAQPKSKILQKFPTDLDYNVMFCQTVILFPQKKKKRGSMLLKLYIYLNTKADSLNSNRNRTTVKSAKGF